MKYAAFVCLFCASALSGCVSPTKSALDRIPSAKAFVLSPADLETVAQGVRLQVKDPFSAIVTNVVGAMDTNGMVNACGLVNGKNSYGAYTGDMPFHGSFMTNKVGQKVFIVTAIGDGGYGSAAVQSVCIKQGMQV